MGDSYLEITDGEEVIRSSEESPTYVVVAESPLNLTVEDVTMNVAVDDGNAIEVYTVGVQGPPGVDGVDGGANGLSWKDSVRAASDANVVLATAVENGDTLDGVTLATDDRILLKDQTAGEENGIYVVAASGAPTRATDNDTEADLLGTAVFVREGTAGADTAWVLSTDAPIVVDTTSLSFTQFGSYTGGAGIDVTGSAISVNVDDSTIEIATDTLQVKDSGITDAKLASTFTKTYSEDVGNASDTSIVVTHNLGSRDVLVSVHDNTTPWAEVYPEVQKTSTTTITLVFDSAPTSAQYRCTVMG